MKTCYQYQNYILIEINDKGNKGGALIGIENSNKNSNFNKICKQDYSNFKYKITAEGYYGGKVNNYIVTDGDDSFGSELSYQIYKINPTTLDSVFESARHDAETFYFIKNHNNKLGLIYWKSIENNTDCSLFENKCLEEIKKQNPIWSTLNFSKCITSTKNRLSELKVTENDDIDNSYLTSTINNHFFVKIEIPDIYKKNNYKILDKNVKYLNHP